MVRGGNRVHGLLHHVALLRHDEPKLSAVVRVVVHVQLVETYSPHILVVHLVLIAPGVHPVPHVRQYLLHELLPYGNLDDERVQLSIEYLIGLVRQTMRPEAEHPFVRGVVQSGLQVMLPLYIVIGRVRHI